MVFPPLREGEAVGARRIGVMLDLDRLAKPERDILAGLRRYAEEHPDWELLIDPFACDHPDRGYQGIVVWSHVRRAIERAGGGVPMVGLTRSYWHYHKSAIPRVLPNIRRAGLLAAWHLRARGFLHFGYVGFNRDCDSYRLRAGFAAHIGRRGSSLQAWLIHRSYLRRALAGGTFDRHLAEWLEQVEKPVGILACTDSLARYVATACAWLGLRVPDDAAIVGVGNDPDLCESPPPSLTSIDLGYESVACQAAEVLDGLINGSPAPWHAWGATPAGMVARRSTELTLYRDRFAQGVARWIGDHSDERLRAADVAAAFGMSLRALQRRCFAGLPGGISGELVRARLHKARRLLLQGDLSIGDVAAACGFGSRLTLERQFKRALGLTPSAWRRQNAPLRAEEGSRVSPQRHRERREERL